MADPCLRNSHYTCAKGWRDQATCANLFDSYEPASQL